MKTKYIKKIIAVALKKARYKILISICISIFVTGSRIILPKLLNLIIDKAQNQQIIKNVIELSLLYLCLAVGSSCLKIVLGNIYVSIKKEIGMYYRENVLEKLPLLSGKFFSNIKSGDLYSLYESDIYKIENLGIDFFLDILGEMLTIVFSLMLLFLIDVKMALILVILEIFLIIIQRLYSKRIANKTKEARKKFGKVSDIVQEYINNITNIILSKSTMFLSKKIFKEQEEMIEQEKELEYIVNINGGIGEIFTGIITIFIYGYGAYKIIQKELTVGNLIAMQQYVWMILGPSIFLLRANVKLNQSMISVQRIYEFMEEPILNTNRDGKEIDEITSVQFNDCYFKYDDKYIFNGISFKVEKGESIAIVGENGSGKTTIIKLLYGLWSVEKGQIYINETIDIRELDISKIRNKMGIVSQDVFIFDDSIYNNITLGKKIDNNIVWEILSDVGLESFINELPDGLETVVGEKGAKLSGGQRQKIAIARVLLDEVDVLILDEATSALDISTQKYLVKRLKKYLKDKIVIIIEHRDALIKEVNYIMALENGVGKIIKNDELEKFI